MKKIIILIFIFLISTSNVYAEERKDFLTDTKIYVNDTLTKKLTDNNYNTFINVFSTDNLIIKNDNKFDSVYIIYYLESKTATLKEDNKEIKLGNNKFLHEFIKLDKLEQEVTIKYDENVKIKEIFTFSGDVPSWVQKWEKPHEDADIMLFTTHSDDEQLFFAGLIPSMVANGKKMQVVYFTNHNNNPIRLDEQLNGLWAVGLKNYPVLGYIPDKYSANLNDAKANMESSGITMEDAIKFEVDMMRRFKPEVVVGHDVNGEYGHGQHILNTHVLQEAIKVVNDKSYNTNYDPFEPSKVYLHLYKENPIIMNYDIPLDYFNGLTAYQVSKLGYKEHNSQQPTWFTRWFTGVNQNGDGTPFEKMTDIKAYKSPITGVTSTFSPTEYGLYYSTVGYDNKDNDMFYNILEKEEVNAKVDSNDENKNGNKELEIVPQEDQKYTFDINKDWYLLISPVIFIISLIILIILLKKQKKRHQKF